jgi:hypothetical protein
MRPGYPADHTISPSAGTDSESSSLGAPSNAPSGRRRRGTSDAEIRKKLDLTVTRFSAFVTALFFEGLCCEKGTIPFRQGASS